MGKAQYNFSMTSVSSLTFFPRLIVIFQNFSKITGVYFLASGLNFLRGNISAVGGSCACYRLLKSDL